MCRILNEQKRGAILEVREERAVGRLGCGLVAGLAGRAGRLPALAEGASGKSTVTYQFVSPEYFGVLGIDLVRGRGFTPTERSASAAVAIVSESVARQLWPGSDAVGQVLRLEPDCHEPRPDRTRSSAEPDDPPLLSRTVVVVGVARDVAGIRLGGCRLAWRRCLHADQRRGGQDVADDACARRFRARAPCARRSAGGDRSQHGRGLHAARPSRTREAYLLGIPFWLTLVLGALALLLTLSGLFSVLSYLVEQRTREIGVRMALGATSGSIGALVLSQSARPVGIGLLLGGSLTAALGAVLLATPAAEQIGSVVRLFDPVAYAASLLCIVTACACAALIPALRAGRIDPVAALRQD